MIIIAENYEEYEAGKQQDIARLVVLIGKDGVVEFDYAGDIFTDTDIPVYYREVLSKLLTIGV